MTAPHTHAEPREPSFARLITTCISARLLVDIGAQIFNPFLPIFAAGLNTDVVVIGRLVSLRNAMGLFAPVFGSLADRYGYHIVLRIALIVSALGMWTIGASPNVAWAAVGVVTIGLGLAAFVPTLQAYLSARLPYAQRARGMGMLEYSWALTGIVGLSLMGQLIALTNWRAPFFLLGAGLAIMAVVFRTLPPARDPARPTTAAKPTAHGSPHARIRRFFIVEQNAASTYATIFAAAANYYAAIQFMIVHGAWYADQYNIGPRELGLVALLFGIFDLIASVSVSLFTDRFGKRRCVILGTVGALLGYLLIPWLNVSLWSAVLSTAAARGFFELAIVANFPLLSEQVPSQRARIMSLSAAISLGAATLATFVAPQVYTIQGIGGVAVISALFTGAALLLLVRFVRERDDSA